MCCILYIQEQVLNLLKVEDSGVLFGKALIQRNDPIQKFLVESQVGQSGKQPAISKLSLKWIDLFILL